MLSPLWSWSPRQSAWTNKFQKNADRMVKSFKRCGTYNSDETVDELSYDEFEPSKGMEALIQGYRNWAERHLSNCNGQRKNNHHAKRMGKWDTILQAQLKEAGCKLYFHLSWLLYLLFINKIFSDDDWKIMKDTNCQSYDVHPMQPAPTIFACVEQCYGFIFYF